MINVVREKNQNNYLNPRQIFAKLFILLQQTLLITIWFDFDNSINGNSNYNNSFKQELKEIRYCTGKALWSDDLLRIQIVMRTKTSIILVGISRISCKVLQKGGELRWKRKMLQNFLFWAELKPNETLVENSYFHLKFMKCYIDTNLLVEVRKGRWHVEIETLTS